jgi:hypothetical protein
MFEDPDRDLRALVAQLATKVEQLEAELAATRRVPSGDDGALAADRRASRRDLLRLGGIAGIAAAGGVVATAAPAAAANGDNMKIGIDNDTMTHRTGLITAAGFDDIIVLAVNATTTTAADVDAIFAKGHGTGAALRGLGGSGGVGVQATGGPNNPGVLAQGGSRGTGAAAAGVWGIGGEDGTGVRGDGGTGDGCGVFGVANGIGSGVFGHGGDNSGAGVEARGGSPNGPGVTATSTGSGAAFVSTPATAGAHARFVPKGPVGPPFSGPHVKGELWVDSSGLWYTCTGDGDPGTWSRVATIKPGFFSGPVYFLSTPIRILDTRLPVDGATRYAADSTHTLTVNNAPDRNGTAVTVPDFAFAAILNVTAASPLGTGNLRLYPANQPTEPTTSTLNYVAGVNVANAATVLLFAGALKIFTDNAATHVIVDVSGFVM